MALSPVGPSQRHAQIESNPCPGTGDRRPDRVGLGVAGLGAGRIARGARRVRPDGTGAGDRRRRTGRRRRADARRLEVDLSRSHFNSGKSPNQIPPTNRISCFYFFQWFSEFLFMDSNNGLLNNN